jgi:F0F1-type ATP synthase assembly protein I
MNIRTTSVAVLFLLIIVACQEMSERAPVPMNTSASTPGVMAEETQRAYSGGEAKKVADSAPGRSALSIAAPEQALAQEQNKAQKLIYNAELELKVENYETADEAIRKKTEELGGYVSDSKSYTNPEGKLHGTATLRIPAEKFPEALIALAALGEVKSKREWVDDVTAEFFDVQTRIANQRALEARLLKLMETHTASLHDLVDLEQKIADVRTVIEQFEGRLRYLSNKIGYSTVTVTYYEPSSALEKEESVLQPLKWALDRVGHLFFGSIGVLIIAFAVALPWGLIIYLCVKAIIYVRRRRKKEKQAS